MAPGAQSETVGNIVVYGTDFIHGLAGKFDTVLEIDRDRCFSSSVTT